MISEITKYSTLANLILDKGTDYFNDKQLIRKIFALGNKDYKETIRLRLTIIDSFYSTNMNLRYYGIANMAEIISFYYKDDLSLIDDLSQFITYPYNDQILDIFNSSYGINKKGEKNGKAISLFSKYAYFLTSFRFPIYDSLVFETYPKIVKRFPELNLTENLSTDISVFVSTMNRFNTISGIDDFNKLDNLLWLIGKILRGNFSLILKESSYSEIVDIIEFDSKASSRQIDKKLREYILLNIEKLDQLIDNNLVVIIKFANELNK